MTEKVRERLASILDLIANYIHEPAGATCEHGKPVGIASIAPFSGFLARSLLAAALTKAPPPPQSAAAAASTRSRSASLV